MKHISLFFVSSFVVLALSACSWPWSLSQSGKQSDSMLPVTIDCNSMPTEEGKKVCKDGETRRINAESDSKAYVEAQEKGDSSICKKISTETGVKSCIVTVDQKKALEIGDTSVCDKQEGPLKENCLKDIYMSMADKTGDSAYCEKIEKDAFKDSCLSALKNRPNTSVGT